MTRITFYEKPGCGGNARQRAALQAAGHELERRDLLAEPWTAERLLDFLAPLPVADWFNRAAPRVRDGEIVPERLSREQALALLLAEPLLIRRPLMRRQDSGSRLVGFDPAAVEAWVGLSPAGPAVGEGCTAPARTCSTATP